MAEGEARLFAGSEPLTLDYVFHPRSVAVVGAKPGGMGAGYLLALHDMTFPGPIYPITPNFQEIEGLRCYASLGDVEGPVDHVISTVPANVLPQLVEDCIAKEARTLQLYTAGFSETGEEIGRASCRERV